MENSLQKNSDLDDIKVLAAEAVVKEGTAIAKEAIASSNNMDADVVSAFTSIATDLRVSPEMRMDAANRADSVNDKRHERNLKYWGYGITFAISILGGVVGIRQIAKK